MEAISTGASNGLKLEEYQGTYSLTSQREGTDGKFYAQWAKYHKSKTEYQEKDWPIKVNLGNKETAIGVLKMLLKEMGAEQDIPF